MSYQINFYRKPLDDIKRLDNSVRPQIIKGIQKVSMNPISFYQGGFGKPLGNKDIADLTGLYKIKFLHIGIRIVYSLEEKDGIMTIIIISVRAENQVYKDAANRRNKYGI